MRLARVARGAVLALCAPAALGVPAAGAGAQRLEPADGGFWAGAAATIVAAAALDRPIRDAVRARDGGRLDELARVGDALGTGKHIVPALAVSYVGARIAHRERWADATLHVAAGYAAADLVESALKPVVGRERPRVSGHPGRFHPFTKAGDYHSFPSAHVTHAAALAAGVAEYADGRRWVAPLCYGAVGLVAWQRLYADQHWASDVAVGATIGVAASKTVVRWLARRAGRPGAPRGAGLTLIPIVTANGVGLGVVVAR